MDLSHPPLVSIIIPCYNQGDTLPLTLDSVLQQSYLDWECIIMDDGSSDNSNIIAQKYTEKDKRFHYYYQNNQGLAQTRNNAIKKSHGEFILPLDSDDLIHKDYIRIAIEEFKKREKVKIVYCKAEYFGAKTGEWKLPEFTWKSFLVSNCIFCSALYRRNDYNQTNGYNPNMKYGYEDWDFWLSLLESGGEVYRIPQILFYYRRKKESMSKDMGKDTLKIQEAHQTILRNHPALYHFHYVDLYNQYQDIIHSRWFVFFKYGRIVSKTMKKLWNRTYL